MPSEEPQRDGAGASPLTALSLGATAPGAYRRFAPLGIDELYGFAAVSICLGSVVGGKAVVFAAAAGLVLICDFKLVLQHGATLLRPRFAPLHLFLLVHLASGLSVSWSTFLHLLSQVGIVAAFAIPFYCRYQFHPMTRFNRAFGRCVIAIIALLVVWHVSQGMLSGWKRLGETKTALTFLPLVMAAFVTKQRFKGPLTIAAVGAVCLIILLSGERKAYYSLAIALLLVANVRSPLTWLSGALALAFLPVAASLDSSGYVARQIDSTLAFAGGRVESTLSNNMREWQTAYAIRLHDEHPLFGIGTKNYVDTMLASYGSSKSDIIAPGLTIHGDLLRVLVENGSVGLAAWLFMLAIAALTTLSRWRPQGLRSPRERKLTIIALSAMILFIAFEAFDTTMMILYWVLPMLGRLNIDPAAPIAPLHPALRK